MMSHANRKLEFELGNVILHPAWPHTPTGSADSNCAYHIKFRTPLAWDIMDHDLSELHSVLLHRLAMQVVVSRLPVGVGSRTCLK